MDDNNVSNDKEVTKNFFQRKKKDNKVSATNKEESQIIEDNDNDISDLFQIDSSSYDPDYQADYQEYLSTFDLKPPIFEGPPLSFEDWKTINYSLDMMHHSNLARLGFIPPIPSGLVDKAGRAAVGYVADKTGAYLADKFSEVTENLDKGDIGAAADAFKSVLSDAAPAVTVIKSTGTDTSDGGSIKIPGGGSGFRAGHNTSSLNLNPKPMEISLDTGIDNTAYGQYFVDGSADFAPLHIAHVSISPNSIDSNSKLSGFISNVVSILFQNAAQAGISFNVSAATIFSITNIVLYLETISRALQVYYFYTSLIAYEDTGNGRNEGMLKLRSMISADDVDLLYQMGRLLRQYPIPPNLRQLIFYLSQTYSQSSVPGSPLIKIMPIKFATSVDVNSKFTGFDSTNISLSFAAMQDANFRTIGSMLARIATGWIEDTLVVPCGNVVHDPQFTTFFVNLPNASSDVSGVARKSPSAATVDTNIVFGTHANKYDGALYALTNIYNSTSNVWTSNLLDVSIRSGYNTTRFTNRVSYIAGLSGNGFYPSNVDNNASYSRMETYVTLNAAAIPYVNSGAESAKGVNINSVSEVSYKLFEWLLNLDSLKIQTNRPSSSGGGRRPKRNSSDKDKDKE